MEEICIFFLRTVDYINKYFPVFARPDKWSPMSDPEPVDHWVMGS